MLLFEREPDFILKHESLVSILSRSEPHSSSSSSSSSGSSSDSSGGGGGSSLEPGFVAVNSGIFVTSQPRTGAGLQQLKTARKCGCEVTTRAYVGQLHVAAV